ncbi:hypothetical protein [Escherichia coli]|uniref:hypothetical protein n=1 Tax=Escherichia coli TaxID=562 RepID=UPI00191C7FFB|nr:hypothetical protein [Escherichia coli]
MSGLEGFGTGFRSYVQAQGTLVNNTNLTDETGKVLNPATPEEIKYASDKLATGNLPEGQDPVRGLLIAWGAGASVLGGELIVPAAYFHERRSLNNPLCQHSCRLDFYTGERLCPHMQYQLI